MGDKTSGMELAVPIGKAVWVTIGQMQQNITKIVFRDTSGVHLHQFICNWYNYGSIITTCVRIYYQDEDMFTVKACIQ
jgi:hypothetical protein